MGRLKNQTLGNISGAVGHIVFKQRGNNCFLSPRPKKYRTPQDPRSASIRNQLRVISNLAGTINNIDLIKKIWQYEFPDSYTPYHKILSANYHHFRYSDFAGTPVLTPNPGFRLTNPQVEINNSELIIKTDPLSPDSGIDFSKEKFIVTASIFLINTREESEIVTFIKYRTGNKTLCEPGSHINLTTPFNFGNCLFAKDETIYKSWSVLITLDKNDNPVHYSEIIPWTSDSNNPNGNNSMNQNKKLKILLKPVKSYPSRSIPIDPLLLPG
jgi:hypothetical protein